MLKKSTIFFDKSLEDVLAQADEGLRIAYANTILKGLETFRTIENTAMRMKLLVPLSDLIPRSYYQPFENRVIFLESGLSEVVLIDALVKTSRLEAVVSADWLKESGTKRQKFCFALRFFTPGPDKPFLTLSYNQFDGHFEDIKLINSPL